jgi:hypothetical protein
VTARTVPCPHCGALFADRNDVYQHIKRRHGGKLARQYRPSVIEQRDPSLASELVDALVSAACGEPVPDYIEAMFPEDVADARATLRATEKEERS